MQKFIKRLRKHLGDKKIKYYLCGEYGDKKNRPHYHVILFGHDFEDKELNKMSNGNALYTSETLGKIWTKGYHYIGHVTFESAAYVARYVMKKWKKDSREDEPMVNMANAIVNRETGEILEVEPEFCLMSRGREKGTAIGASWLEQFRGDTDKDFITIKGQPMSLPKYYDLLLERIDPDQMLERKGERIKNRNQYENTRERLEAREKVKEAQAKMLTRPIEEIQEDENQRI